MGKAKKRQPPAWNGPRLVAAMRLNGWGGENGWMDLATALAGAGGRRLLSRQQIHVWRTGKGSPSGVNLVLLCRVFGHPVEYFYTKA